MQPDIVSDLPCQQRMLLRRIISDQQNRRRVVHIAHGRGGVRLCRKRRSKSREVGGAVMIDVVGPQHHAREFLQQIIFFVGGASRSDHADRLSALLIPNCLESPSDHLECLFPGGRNQSSVFADQRLRQPVFIIREVETRNGP